MENEDKIYCVYLHVNKINGKKYCGQTRQDLSKRFRNGSGYKECSRFYNAILKYGWNNFDHIILQDNLTKEEADELEIKTIAEENLSDDRYGYNISLGGQLYRPPLEDLTGQIFERLTVIGLDPDNKGQWLCECSCGNTVSVAGQSLKKGLTKSCGCLRKEVNKETGKNRTDCHHQSGTHLYRIWNGMKQRKTAVYGIDQSWNDFTGFYEWSKQSGYTEGQYLLQVDPTLGFNPQNCVWGDKLHSKSNARCKLYSVYGELKSLRQLSEEYQIPISVLHQRISRYDVIDWDKVLNTPYKYIPQDITNEYFESERYGIIKIVEKEIDILLDLDTYETAKQYIWNVNSKGNIVTSTRNRQNPIQLIYLVLGIKKKDMRSFKVSYLDGNKYNLQLSNIHVTIPDGIFEDEYFYIMRNIQETGIMFDNGIRIGKKGDTRKSFHNLADALQYYDERYNTNLLQGYVEYTQLQQIVK